MRAPTQTVGKGHVVQTFSVSELASVHSMRAHPEGAKDGNLRRSTPEVLSREMGASWLGGITTTAQAESLLNHGWSEGANRLTDMINQLTPPTAKSRRRRGAWRDEGIELNVDRAMVGNWDAAWRTSVKEWSQGSNTVTVVTTWGGHVAVTAEELFWQGAAAAVVSDVLESAGYRVRIVAGLTTRTAGGTGTTFVTVKEEHEPMRIDAAASVLCHAGVFRSFAFRAVCLYPFRVGGGHGGVERGWPESRIEAIKAAGQWPEDSIVLGEAKSKDACLREIARVVDLLGGAQ